MGAPVDWGAGLFAFAGLVLLAVMLLAFFEWYLSRKWADKSAEESKGIHPLPHFSVWSKYPFLTTLLIVLKTHHIPQSGEDNQLSHPYKPFSASQVSLRPSFLLL
jgi:hypothetical protein